MELKRFQRNALKTLEAYLERARLTADPERAFNEILRQQEPNSSPPPYRKIPKLPGVPNVLADTKDMKEKQNIGQLWAEKSGGKGLFLMAEKRDAQGRDVRTQIMSAVDGQAAIAKDRLAEK